MRNKNFFIKKRMINGFNVVKEQYPFKTQCPIKNQLKNVSILGNTDIKNNNSNLAWIGGWESTQENIKIPNASGVVMTEDFGSGEDIQALTGLYCGDLIVISYTISVADLSGWQDRTTGRFFWKKQDGSEFIAFQGKEKPIDGNSADVEFFLQLPYDIDDFKNIYIYGCKNNIKTTITNFNIEKISKNIKKDLFNFTSIQNPDTFSSCGDVLSTYKMISSGEGKILTSEGNVLFEDGSTMGDYNIPITLRGKNLFPIDKIKEDNMSVDENNNSVLLNGEEISFSNFLNITGLKNEDYIGVALKCKNFNGDNYNTFNKFFFEKKDLNQSNTYDYSEILLNGSLYRKDYRKYQVSKINPSQLNNSYGTLKLFGLEKKDTNFYDIQIELLDNLDLELSAFERYREPQSIVNIKTSNPLRGISKNKFFRNKESFDYIDFNQNRIVRKLKEITLDGNSGWVELFYENENMQNSYYFKCKLPKPIKKNGAVICNMTKMGGSYKFTEDSSLDFITSYYAFEDDNSVYLQIKKSNVDKNMGVSGLDMFKKLLSIKPMTVIYEMADMEYEDNETIKDVTIELPEGGSTITVDTKINPYKIVGEYISVEM